MPDSPSDAELVRAAQAGEMPAVSVLLEKHRAGMFAAALSILGNVPDAEDVVQDAALIALRRVSDVRRPESRPAVLEDSGHPGHLDQPEAFAEAVRDFVESTQG